MEVSTGISVLGDIIDLLTGGLVKMGEALGGGVNAIVTNLFVQTVGEGSNATTTLSVFGIITCVFGGIALAIGLGRRFVMWIQTLGNKGK